MKTHVELPIKIPTGLATKLAKLGPLLDAGDDAKRFGEKIVTISLGTTPANLEYRLVACFLFAKGFRTFQAAQSLCRCGYGSDALSLCASVFENVVNLLYVTRAPFRSSRRFIQYEQVEKYYQAQKILARKRLPKGRRAIYRNYEKMLTPDAIKLTKYFPKRSQGWAQKPIKDRAKAVHADLAYDELYWVFCGHKHTAPAATFGSTLAETIEPEIAVTPDIRSVYHAACHSTDLFLSLSTAFIKIFHLPLKKQIDDLRNTLERAAADAMRSFPELCE